MAWARMVQRAGVWLPFVVVVAGAAILILLLTTDRGAAIGRELEVVREDVHGWVTVTRVERAEPSALSGIDVSYRNGARVGAISDDASLYYVNLTIRGDLPAHAVDLSGVDTDGARVLALAFPEGTTFGPCPGFVRGTGCQVVLVPSQAGLRYITVFGQVWAVGRGGR